MVSCMSSLPTPFLVGDHALAERLEWAEARVNAAAARVLGGHKAVLEIGGGSASFGGTGSPINKALGLGIREPATAGHVDAVLAFFLERGAPAEIGVCPLGHPSLLTHLTRARFVLSEFEQVLVGTPETVHAAPPGPGIIVRGDVMATIWAPIAAAAFPQERTRMLIPLGTALGSVPGASCFVATIDGEPAGAAALAIHDDVALLFAASVIPAFRYRGVQGALLSARIAAARARGCRLFTVAAAPGSSSQRNAERAGFRVAYSRCEMIARAG
jgi:GNAT superfamily N-acetyltransferase